MSLCEDYHLAKGEFICLSGRSDQTIPNEADALLWNFSLEKSREKKREGEKERERDRSMRCTDKDMENILLIFHIFFISAMQSS